MHTAAEPDRPNVLLVDDRRENLLALRVVLEPLDVRLVMAGSGEEALRALLDEDFAVVLLDVQVPGMDGFETAGFSLALSSTTTSSRFACSGCSTSGASGASGGCVRGGSSALLLS